MQQQLNGDSVTDSESAFGAALKEDADAGAGAWDLEWVVLLGSGITDDGLSWG